MMIKNTWILPALVLGGVVGAGCSPSGTATTVVATPAPTVTTTATTTSTATATQTQAAQPTQPTSTQTQTQPAGTATVTQTASPATSGPAGPAVTTCVNTDLEAVATSDPNGTGAGHIGVKFTVKNIGAQPCSIPVEATIMFITGPEKPQQIGSGAVFEPQPTRPLTVQPGQSVSSALSITQAANIEGCQPQEAWALALATAPDTWTVAPVQNVRGCADGNHMIINAKPFTA